MQPIEQQGLNPEITQIIYDAGIIAVLIIDEDWDTITKNTREISDLIENIER